MGLISGRCNKRSTIMIYDSRVCISNLLACGTLESYFTIIDKIGHKRLWLTFSVTSKKLPNVYEGCPK